VKVVFIRTPKTGSSSIAASLPKGSWKAHETLRYWLGQGVRVSTFAFIRNPWERLYSWYRHEAYFRRTDFRDYVLSEALTEEYVHGQFRMGIKIADQYEWICHEDKYPTCIGRFENLEEDYEAIVGYLNLDAKLPLGHERINPHLAEYPYSPTVWTPEMVDHMDPLFGPFAEEFNYQAPA